MTDFSKIHSFNLGQRNSFEELVCQLARREQFPKSSVFRRVEGAGGDGGVEAYWTKPNGKKTGYQAKYFPRSAAIDWAQIDESVSQALVSHPQLECYVVALPCDLTGKSGNKQRGKTGWEHWETHVKKWEKAAAKAGIKEIEFQPWTDNDLIARLASKDAEGLREFFFGDVELSIEWFGDKIQEAISLLGERFHPEDHVDLRIERLFSVVSRAPLCRQELLKALYAIGKCVLPDKRLSKLEQNPDKQVTDEVRQAIADLLTIDDQIGLDPQHDWDAGSWRDLAEKLIEKNDKLQQWYWDYDLSLNEKSHDRYDLRQLIQESKELENRAAKLLTILRSPYMDAEKQSLAFIRGNAGSGKSHLLAKCAENAFKQQHSAVLLLGQCINDSELWTQISQIMGLPGKSAEQILGALNSAGRAAGARTLLLIDAINEGAGSRIWRNQIAGLIHKLKGFSHVCCVISCLCVANCYSCCYG